MADSTPPAPPSAAPQHKPADCAACRIADAIAAAIRIEQAAECAPDLRTLTREAAFRSAKRIAQHECPAHQAAWAVDA